MRLPRHHVPRPRLTLPCSDEAVVVVEAASGLGKSVLAMELADTWGAVPIVVALGHVDVTGRLLVARLRAAVAAAGYTEAAAVAASPGVDPAAALDETVRALAGESCAFLVDDAEAAAPDAAELLGRLAGLVALPQRLVVLARALPAGAEALHRAGFAHLDARDLALDDAEAAEICRVGFHLEHVTDPMVARLQRVTKGWTAATVLAAARAASTGRPIEVEGLDVGTASGRVEVIETLLAEAVRSIGRDAAAQLARLPLLDASLVAVALGDEALFARALTGGLPLVPVRDGWWELPGAVRESLATFGALDPSAMVRAGTCYVARGEVRAAVELLSAAGAEAAAAAALAAAAPSTVESMDLEELESLVDGLSDAHLDAHPEALMHLARKRRIATRFDASVRLLDRVGRLAAASGDAALAREVDAERALELQRLLRPEDAAVLATSVLATASPAETLTRARSSQALAQSLCWRLNDEGRRDDDALERAASAFRRTVRLYRELEMPSAAAAVVPYWAINIEFARGAAHRALEMLDAALVEATGNWWRRTFILCFRAWVAAELGMDDVCRDSAAELLDVAGRTDSDLFYAHAHWKLAILSSYRGDADAALEHVRAVEQHREGWWGPGSGDFLAEAADLLDRVGHVALAREYLDRVAAEPKDAAHLVAMSAAAIESRHGDPVRAQRLLDEVGSTRVDPREYWRISLLGAYAALRAGDVARAGPLAARAFEQAAGIGQATAPLIKEAAATAQLAGLARETGLPAAVALEAAVAPRRICVLGRFELSSDGRAVPLGGGQEVQLLKLLALQRRLHVEAVLTRFWPDSDVASGRNRLRTVLGRLRSAAGEVVERQGDTLALAADVTVDVEQMLAEAAAARALAGGDLRVAAAVARGAMARYHGELLPDDPYEEWVVESREAARVAMLDVLSLCVDEAASRVDLDEVRRLVHRAIEVDPYGDELAVRTAALLAREGRHGEALSILRRAKVSFGELRVETPRAIAELERRLRS